jgi:hypothetical protein
MLSASRQHLHENNMTYWQHFFFAAKHGLGCLLAGFYLICHAICPALFSTAGSDLLQRLDRVFSRHPN